jgi:hypothetical protein
MFAAFQDAAVVVSELVSNALCHGARVGPGEPARGQVELTLWHRASHLVCAVTDPSTEPPVLRPPDPSAEAGRGLQVVQGLAVCWGWAMLGFHRKVVWAALRVPQVFPISLPRSRRRASSVGTRPRGTAVQGTSFPGTAFPGTAFPGTAFPGTGFPGTAFPGAKSLGTSFPGRQVPYYPGRTRSSAHGVTTKPRAGRHSRDRIRGCPAAGPHRA